MRRPIATATPCGQRCRMQRWQGASPPRYWKAKAPRSSSERAERRPERVPLERVHRTIPTTRKPPTSAATETLKTSVSRFSMKSRIGSPKRQSSAAIRKKRMPREMTEADGEGQEVEVERPARDGDELVGDGRRPLDDDEPGAPLVVEMPQPEILLGDAVEAQQRLADGVEGEIADGVAEEAAEHRGDGGDQRVVPGPPPVGDDHRHEQRVGRDREERALDEADDRQRPDRVAGSGERQGPLVKLT